MRKIAIIPPIPVTEAEAKRRIDRYTELFAGRATPAFYNLEGGPKLTDSEYDLFWATVYIILRGEEAEREGCDGVIIDCTADPGVPELRQSLSIPVAGALAAAFSGAVAQLPGNPDGKIAVLALDDDWKRMLASKTAAYGYSSLLSSIETVGMHLYHPEHDISTHVEHFRECLLAAGKRAVERGADVIIPGSTTIMQQADILGSRLGVPVIDPGAAVVEAILELAPSAAEQPARIQQPKYGDVVRERLFRQ